MPQKNKNKAKAEAAVSHILAHNNSTYRQVAAMYGVTIHQIRARINNRYQSLARGRVIERQKLSDNMRSKWNRPCMVCKQPKERDFGQYICDTCKAEKSRQHDGVV